MTDEVLGHLRAMAETATPPLGGGFITTSSAVVLSLLDRLAAVESERDNLVRDRDQASVRWSLLLERAEAAERVALAADRLRGATIAFLLATIRHAGDGHDLSAEAESTAGEIHAYDAARGTP